MLPLLALHHADAYKHTVAVELKVPVGAVLTAIAVKESTPLPMESTAIEGFSLSTTAPARTRMMP